MLSQKISFQNKHVLVCPLDWGLGHAARCISLIKQLQQQNNTIIIACTQNQKAFLLNEISTTEYVDLFGYNVKYSKSVPLWLKILVQFPRLCFVVRKENNWLKKFVNSNKIDVVISDNRFGLYNKNTENIFITHQLFIKAPFLSGLINYINHAFIKKFDQCWIPDYAGKENSLSGELSHGKYVLKNTHYIKPFSRFERREITNEKIYDILILLSGVEPQRSLLEEKLVEVLKNSSLKIALVRGVSSEKLFPENFFAINVATSKQLQDLFYSSKNIICRSGYSTLMDLHTLNLKAILIPTPGQTEQEYLADYWQKNFGFNVLKQNEIDQKNILSLVQ